MVKHIPRSAYPSSYFKVTCKVSIRNKKVSIFWTYNYDRHAHRLTKTHTYTHAHTHVHTHTRTHAHTHARTNARTHIHTHKHTHTHIPPRLTKAHTHIPTMMLEFCAVVPRNTSRPHSLSRSVRMFAKCPPCC